MSEQNEVEAEPERTPENSDLDALWQKAEVTLQEERQKKVANPWSSYKGLSKGSRGYGSSPTTRSTTTDDFDHLWEQSELEIRRRRAKQQSKGFRVYDISDGKGSKGFKSKGFKGGKGYPERPRVYPSKSAENCWKDTLQKQGHFWKILLSRRRIDDGILNHWCKWAQTHLNRLPPKAVISMVDVSFNQITATGLGVLLQTLTAADVPVEALSLHHNLLNDVAANELAQYLQHSSYTLYQLHLSYNQISELGARSLLEAAVKALQSPLELVSGSRPSVRYPCERQGHLVPLWLRLSNNRIGDGRGSAWIRGFLQNLEHELLPTRQQVSQTVSDDPWGILDERQAQLFCEALGAYGCNQSTCSQTYPEQPGLPPGPVCHLPFWDTQATRRSELPRERPREGPWERPWERPQRHQQERPKGRVATAQPREVLSRSTEEVDLLDLDWEPAEATSQGDTSKDDKCITLLEDLAPEGEPEVILRTGDVGRVLYEGSEGLDDEGFLYVSFPEWEGWIPESAVRR